MVTAMPLLDDAAVDTALQHLGWARSDDGQLMKVVTRDDFTEAMDFVNEVAGLAEAANHHPDIDIRWNKITLHLSTHSAGGITEKDLALADQIDGLG
jgi:4a-hydroxytetrahydrobiopterin dehydratase